MRLFNSVLLSSPLLLAGCACTDSESVRPNIIWITIEDWSTDVGCYGTKGVHTPNIDKLAAEGIMYTNAYTTAPVSSASRSAMMTGYQQNFIGASQHRLAPADRRELPEGVVSHPNLMSEAGYHTHLMSWKTDCNYAPSTAEELFDQTDKWNKWDRSQPFIEANREDGKPLFARITFSDTHRKWNRDPERPIPTSDVELPPYYVDNEFARRDWANGLEQLQIVDRQVGEFVDYIDSIGMGENTLLIFIADNGRCHFRGKQFLYEPGTKIPMIIRWLGKIKPGQVCDELVSTLDICKTTADIAGAKPKVPLHGLNLFNGDIEDREYIFTARDKMDLTHDAMRAVRAKDGYKLIHNLMPERPYLQYSSYKEGAYPVLAEMSYLYQVGQLNEVQSLFFAASKPEYELYDLNNDPYEINNLAAMPRYKGKLNELLSVLNDWRESVNDQGVSDDFRAVDIYPKESPEESVEIFVSGNLKKCDFARYGTPAWYPTRSAEEWRKIRDEWMAWVFRDPSSKNGYPTDIVYTGKK